VRKNILFESLGSTFVSGHGIAQHYPTVAHRYPYHALEVSGKVQVDILLVSC
jgi:hypothetical protein